MTFIQAWSIVFTWLIVAACGLAIIGAAYEAIKTHGLDRVAPAVASLILTWVGGMYFLYWGLWATPVPPEIFRPGIFALAMTVLMLLVGYRRAKS